jgi:hypothetical protein
MEPLVNIYNQLATKAYNKETRIHTHMHSVFSSQQLPHKTFFMQLTTLTFSESPSIPFIAIMRESFAAVGCHLASAHCLVQLAYSSKQPTTNLNSTNNHALLVATRQPCRPSCSTPYLLKCPDSFLPLDHALQA